MSRLKFSMREIGSVRVFDLTGEPNQDSLQEVAWRMQRSIRRHRLQRVILNLQRIKSLDELGIRKLVAAFLRPQRSAIYGTCPEVKHRLEDTYLPENIKICPTEREVAEDLGPFLFHKEEMGQILGENDKRHGVRGPGMKMERRRSKRMHVAIPLDATLHPEGREPIFTRAIATNISEGGMFVDYLDLDALKAIEVLGALDGMRIEIQIHPSGNFPEEYHLEGTIRRKDEAKRGLGLAVEFNSGF